MKGFSSLTNKVPVAVVITILIIGSLSISLMLFTGQQESTNDLSDTTEDLPDIPDDLPDPYDLGTDLVPTIFADYVDYEREFIANAPSYTLEPDLSNVLNLEDFSTSYRLWWNDDIANEIAENYYAVPGLRTPQFQTIYNINYYDGIPSFVTTDAVLHAYHTLYDIALRTIENDTLYDQLLLLSKHQVECSLQQYDHITDAQVKHAALLNIAFYSVAVKLLDPLWQTPFSVEEVVQEVLALIDSASGFSHDWFMDQIEDFSQYIPRGHYTKSESLERFFKAMMWYGRIGFRLLPADNWLSDVENREKGRNETIQGILATIALHQESTILSVADQATTLWSSIYDITSFFVGTSDDLSPFEYKTLHAVIYGNDTSLNSLGNETLLDSFISTAMNCRDPMILSGFLLDTADAAINTKGFRFMGQRFVVDSYVLGQLVYKYVGTPLNPRTMPKGLDVMSAYGSDLAWALLDDQKGYEEYISQMDLLRESISEMNESTWQQNLYWLWSYSFLPLLWERDLGYPTFMQNSGWTEKQLMTALATWTELRHDTVLYAKQSYCFYYGVPACPNGYVEPFPDLYARLASLCRMMLEGLVSRVELEEGLVVTLQNLHDTLLTLQDISIKELSGVAFNSTDDDFLRHIGIILSDIEGYGGEGGRAALATDVHTDSINQVVLQEATGNPMVIYVAVPNADGEPYLTRGAIYSYYEFVKPMSDRLTDESWWDILDEGSEPEMPEWTNAFIMGNSSALEVMILHLSYASSENRMREYFQAVLPIASISRLE